MAKVIGIINQKGGVGKTTTTIELAYAIGQERRVLVIDLDQQANLSKYMKADTSVPSIFKALTNTPIKSAIQQVNNKVDLIRGSEELSRADREFIDVDDFFRLKDILESVQNDYDYILIDNGPSRTTLLSMLYIAADYIVIPTEADDGSVDGIVKVQEDLEKFRTKRTHMTDAKIAMLILTKYENTIAHRDIKSQLDDISEEYIDHPTVTTVRKGIVATDSKTFRMSIQEYDKNSNTADDYRNVARILMMEVV